MNLETRLNVLQVRIEVQDHPERDKVLEIVKQMRNRLKEASPFVRASLEVEAGNLMHWLDVAREEMEKGDTIPAPPNFPISLPPEMIDLKVDKNFNPPTNQ